MKKRLKMRGKTWKKEEKKEKSWQSLRRETSRVWITMERLKRKKPKGKTSDKFSKNQVNFYVIHTMSLSADASMQETNK